MEGRCRYRTSRWRQRPVRGLAESVGLLSTEQALYPPFNIIHIPWKYNRKADMVSGDIGIFYKRRCDLLV